MNESPDKLVRGRELQQISSFHYNINCPVLPQFNNTILHKHLTSFSWSTVAPAWSNSSVTWRCPPWLARYRGVDPSCEQQSKSRNTSKHTTVKVIHSSKLKCEAHFINQVLLQTNAVFSSLQIGFMISFYFFSPWIFLIQFGNWSDGTCYTGLHRSSCSKFPDLIQHVY